MISDFDAWLKDAVTRDTIPDFASPSDHFMTAGGLQFDFSDNSRRLRSGHVLDFKGATLELDVNQIPDAMLLAGQAPLMLGSEMGQCYAKRANPEEAWSAVSAHITVMNVNLIANYSKLAPRARALGLKQFAIAGLGLQGHDAHGVNIGLSDFGAYGREAFPCWVTGTDNAFDSYALYGIVEGHYFDEGGTVSSLDYHFKDFNPALSPDQVSVGIITGTLAPGSFQESPWKMSKPWRHIWRKDAKLTGTVTCPPAQFNNVQGGTVYQALHATVDLRTENAKNLYYSDYYRSRGVHILPTCVAKGANYAVEIHLSPTADGYPELPPEFSAEDFVIEYFESQSKYADVMLNAELLPGDQPNPPTRYLRNIAIDERLTVKGNKEGYVVIPAPKTKRKGCFR